MAVAQQPDAQRGPAARRVARPGENYALHGPVARCEARPCGPAWSVVVGLAARSMYDPRSGPAAAGL